MDIPLYDVYLTGKLADGLTADIAAQRLAALFKSTPAAMSGMLTGKPQILKRGVDKATALKYREALQKAGVEVAFKEVGTGVTAAASTSPAAAAESARAGGLQLAPVGSELLRDDERPAPSTTHIDTTHFSVAELSPFPAQHPAIEPVTPDIGYLSLAAAGSSVLSEAERSHTPAAVPDTSALSLAPAGAPLETLTTATTAIDPDISQLTLAPAGTDLLSEEQRRKPAVSPPNTAHIQLEKY